ncbi:IQ motif and SEC7 domain-containing protein 1-like isoform X2 [Tachysurus ichikawai]
MWCLQCNSEKTQSLLELELDGCFTTASLQHRSTILPLASCSRLIVKIPDCIVVSFFVVEFSQKTMTHDCIKNI